MEHEAKVVEVKELTDELVSYRLRCCDEELSDSWHTLTVHIEDHEKHLTERKQEIEKRHRAKEAWRTKYKANERPNPSR